MNIRNKMERYLLKQLTRSNFETLERTGEGAQAQVFRGNVTEKIYREVLRSEGPRTVAVKLFRYSNGEFCHREVEFLSMLKHKNIIRIIALYSVPNGQWGFVMEFMEIGSLFGIIYQPKLKYGMRQVFKWMEMIMSGLHWLHDQNILHRDINPNNILLGRSLDDLKLSDFGLARWNEGPQPFSYVGNRQYMAPEVKDDGCYGKNADIYSFAITVWEIIYRRRPEKNFPDDRMDAELQYLIRRGWNENPEERPDLDEYYMYTLTYKNDYEQDDRICLPHDISNGAKIDNINPLNFPNELLDIDISPSAPTIDLDIINNLPIRLNQLHELSALKDWIVPVASIFRPTPITNNEPMLMFLFGGIVNGTATDDVIGYDGLKHIWERWDRAKLPYPSQAHGVVLCNNQIYLIGGGQTEYYPVSSLYKWKHKWIRCQNMNHTRCHISRSCVVVNDNIYVIGGFGEGEALSSVEKYDPNTNKWTWIGSMNEPRSNASAGVVRNLIFVCGGYNGRETLKSVECLNTKDRQPEWRKIECDMPGPRSGTSLLIEGDHLILIGGYDGFNYHSTIWKYNTSKTKLWKCLTGFNIKINRSDGYAAIVNDSILIVGGITTGKVIAHDFETLTRSRHTFGPPLPLNLAASTVLVARGH